MSFNYAVRDVAHPTINSMSSMLTVHVPHGLLGIVLLQKAGNTLLMVRVITDSSKSVTLKTKTNSLKHTDCSCHL